MRRIGWLLAVVTFAGFSGGGTAWAAVEYVPPVRGPIIRHFEPPPTPYAAGHRGIDIAAPVGTAVLAAAGGRVAFAGQVGGSLCVSIDHPDGVRTTYSFLSGVSVQSGQQVAQGQPIALSGQGHSGSDQPHLHFGAMIGERYLDPEALLVERFRRDYSALIRLAPAPAGAPGGSVLLVPALVAAAAGAGRSRRERDGGLGARRRRGL